MVVFPLILVVMITAITDGSTGVPPNIVELLKLCEDGIAVVWPTGFDYNVARQTVSEYRIHNTSNYIKICGNLESASSNEIAAKEKPSEVADPDADPRPPLSDFIVASDDHELN